MGPFLGSLLAVGFYKFVKLLEYESVNPCQDSDGHDGCGSEEEMKKRGSSSSSDDPHALENGMLSGNGHAVNGGA